MNNLFGDIKQLNYKEQHIKSDIIEEFSDDEYLSKIPSAQLFRVDEYCELTEMACENAEAYGVPYISAIGKLKHKKQKELKISNLKYLNLDRDYKILLYEKLSELVINGSKVVLTFPTIKDSFDIKLSW